MRDFDQLVGALYLDGELVGFLRTRIVQWKPRRRILGSRGVPTARLAWYTHIIGRHWSDEGFFEDDELPELAAGRIAQLGDCYLVKWLKQPQSIEVGRRYFGGD